MVVDVMLLQITVCMFPVDWTVVKQLRNLSSGHLHTTSVVEPKTGAAEAAAAVELSDPGRQVLSFFLIVVISFTPGTGLHFTCSVTSLKTLLQLPTFSPLLSPHSLCRLCQLSLGIGLGLGLGLDNG